MEKKIFGNCNKISELTLECFLEGINLNEIQILDEDENIIEELEITDIITSLDNDILNQTSLLLEVGNEKQVEVNFEDIYLELDNDFTSALGYPLDTDVSLSEILDFFKNDLEDDGENYEAYIEYIRSTYNYEFVEDIPSYKKFTEKYMVYDNNEIYDYLEGIVKEEVELGGYVSKLIDMYFDFNRMLDDYCRNQEVINVNDTYFLVEK